jgi:putative hydrolase of the HAD superfamily
VVSEGRKESIMKHMHIQGIFFDLYGTLLVYGNMKKAWSDWLSTFYGLLDQQGLKIPEEAFSQECDGFFSTKEPGENGNNLTALERRIDSLCARLNHRLDKTELRHIADKIAQAWQTHIFIDPETIPVLTVLKQNKIVGLISNFDHPPHVRRILSINGLENFFDAVIISGEVGLKKPDPAIFSVALEQTGLLRDEVMYIGDTDDDVAGAAAAGIRPIFIARPVNGTGSAALDFQTAYPDQDFPQKGSSQNKVTVISSLREILRIANS